MIEKHVLSQNCVSKTKLAEHFHDILIFITEHHGSMDSFVTEHGVVVI